jgi:hypothetical protein
MTNDKQTIGEYAHVFDTPVAEIDMQGLIDKQIKTGVPIILTMPKNVTADTKKVLDKLNNDLVKKGAKLVVIDRNNSTEE